ncbi:hypothetical protein BKI52_27805 [marine bacterium AO1-C]|nr:hypothetical protein BKI52_27805 [marine bacterium AO1-C]
MKQIICVTMMAGCMLWGMEGVGQQNQQIRHYIKQLLPNKTVQLNTVDHISQQINSYVNTLVQKRKRYNNDRRFLKFVFYNVHKKFLKHYKMHRDFSDIFSDQKNYNCVSAATLYALILQQLDIKYTIHETPFHVYLVAHTPKYPEILLDPTDPHQGFLYNPYAIRKRVRYHSETDGEKLNLRISLQQLVGLQYYNQGVYKFNHRKFDQALVKLTRAQELYPSERVKALLALTHNYYKAALAEK